MREQKQSRWLSGLCILLAALFCSQGSAQGYRWLCEYETEGEKGRLEISESGELVWTIGSGLSAIRSEYDLGLDQIPEIDRIKQYGWLGVGRRFLISGVKFEADHRKTPLVLIELLRNPERLKIRSRVDPGVEVKDFAYDPFREELFLLEESRSAILMGKYLRSDATLPGDESWHEIADSSKLYNHSLASIAIADEWEGLSAKSESFGAGAWHDSVYFRLIREESDWRIFHLMSGFLSLWGPGSVALDIPSSLECMVSGETYVLLRLDLPGEPRELLRGSVPTGGSQIDRMLTEIEVPAGTLTPGARYAIVDAEWAKDYQGGLSAPVQSIYVQQFFALTRHGQSFEPDSLRIGPGRPAGDSTLGNEQFSLLVESSTAKRDWWDQSAELWLYWSVVPEGAVGVLDQRGKHAMIDPMGAEILSVEYLEKAAQHSEIELPLTDARMAEGGFLQMQFLLWSEGEMALSDVFATTIFPAEGASEVELSPGSGLSSEAQIRWAEVRKRFSGRSR